MKLTRPGSAPLPATAPPTTAPSERVASPAAASALDTWCGAELGRLRPGDQQSELRAFAPVALRLARARAERDVRPLYVEALALHLMSERLASYVFRGAQPSAAFTDQLAERMLDRAERSPVTHVLAFLAGGRKVHHLSEAEIRRELGVHVERGPGPSGGLWSRESSASYQAALDSAVERFVASRREYLVGTPSSPPPVRAEVAPASSPSPSSLAPRGPVSFRILGIPFHVADRSTMSGTEQWKDLEPW